MPQARSITEQCKTASPNVYSHCLSLLLPSGSRLSVANNTKIVLIGRWFGIMEVGTITAASWFEVFDSHSAFEVILGKPWLHQVKPIHNYITDRITIPRVGQTDAIENLLNQTTQLSAPPSLETPPKEQLDQECTCIHQIHASNSP